MYYYIGSMQCDSNYLTHHGTKGMRWGVRKYQNEDGSLTPEGRRRYGDWQDTRGKDIYQKQQIRRMNRAQKKIARANNGLESNSKRDREAELKYRDNAGMVQPVKWRSPEKTQQVLEKRRAKAQAKYDKAKSRLEGYENASEAEKKKARNSIRLRRAAIASAAAIAAAGIGLSAISNDQMKIVGEKFTRKYVKNDIRTTMSENYFTSGNVTKKYDKILYGMADGRKGYGGMGIGSKVYNMKKLGYRPGAQFTNQEFDILNRIRDTGRYARAGAVGAGIAGVGAAATYGRNRHPSERKKKR